MDLVENAVVAGRFRLNRMLGRGGMGSVWHATHLGLDIPCAVKFIEGEFASIPEAAVRFEREAKAAAQLRSPHVVQILDHGVSEGRPYIAMELLDGEDLGKRLQARGKLAPSEVNVVLAQVCRALTKAHALGIVHRDLKPDNIFLVRDDDREISKVLDFGIAKSGGGMETGSNTRTGAMLGTPYYMSPEQAQGIKSVDYRSDLWSLAVIAFQCVTGRLPFESEALGDLLVKIIVSPIPVPSQFGPVPPAFDAWWAKAASRDPNARFQSAKEFSDSLGLALGGSAVTDVIDMRALMARQGGQGTSPGAAPGSDPGLGSNPHLPVAGAQLPQTPNPFGHAPPGGGTPVSAMAESMAVRDPSQFNNPQPVSATTGAPIARTYSDVGMPAAQRKKGAAVVIGIGLTGFVLVGSIIGYVVFHGAKGGAAAAGSGEAPSASVQVATAQATPPPPPPVTTLATAAPAASSAAPAVASAASAAPPAAVAKTGSGTTSTSTHHSSTTTAAPASATQPATTTKTAGSKEVKAVESMGF